MKTSEQVPDNTDTESLSGLTIGSLVCSGIAVILFFVSCVPDFEDGGAVWRWPGLVLTVLVAILAIVALRSGLLLRHKLIITLGAAVPVALYVYLLLLVVFLY